MNPLIRQEMENLIIDLYYNQKKSLEKYNEVYL